MANVESSNGTQIARAEGCWDTEAEADAALDAACEKKREAWCDGFGVAYDDEIADDRFRGWLGDYQRTAITFEVIPTVDGHLDHSSREILSLGEISQHEIAE